jgi:hypothetical protein
MPFTRPVDRVVEEFEMPTSSAPSPRRLAVLILSLGLGLLATSRPASPQSAPPAAPSGSPAAAPPAAAGGFDFAGQREEVFKAFYSTGLDTATAYAVANLALKKDNTTILLKQGTLFLMKPIGGEVTGAAFIGDGEASMTPPNRTQRFMLNKYSGSETLKEPFTEAVLRFTDGTERTLRALGKAGAGDATAAPKATQILSDRNGWLNVRQNHFEMQFLENRISGLKGQDYFIADFHTVKHDWLTYIYNPQEFHENLLTASETMGAKSRRYLIPWAQWHESSELDPAGHYVALPDRDGPHVIRVKHDDMILNMVNTDDVEWELTMQVEPLMNNLRALRFDLDNNADPERHWYEDFRPIKLLTVTDAAGQALPFLHAHDQLIVVLPQPASTGSVLSLTFKGKASKITEQLTAESFGLIQVSWYPTYGYQGGRHPFHWTARVPKSFLVTGSGKILREFEDKEKGQNVIESACDLPVEFPWIVFGRFQKSASTYNGEGSTKPIPMTIHSFPSMSVTITDSDVLDALGATKPIHVQLTAPQKKIDGFFEEWKQVLKLYEKIYGAYPYDELHIAQVAPQVNFLGQSPQGFVQLTGLAFMSQGALAAEEVSSGPTDFVHGLVAHEFAHQWWGHQIGWASDDNEWLSESFAEYASGIFVKEYQGPKRFQNTLLDWKKNAKVGDPEGPIAAANMLNGPNAYDYRIYLLYNKGPYVLHMLRVQLDDQTYSKVMQDVQQTYKNQNITTEMLLREVNRVTGQDYTYFFDQWFWDVGIPRFQYSWRSEKQPDGKFLITVHVAQTDRNHLKRVLMPIHLHFKDKTIPQYKGIVQAEQDIKLMSPVEPKDVTLDDEHTLLADIVKAG